jgi:hypothetical protein
MTTPVRRAAGLLAALFLAAACGAQVGQSPGGTQSASQPAASASAPAESPAESPGESASGSAQAPSGDPITIGGSLVLTGPQAPFDEPGLRGANLAVEHINANGGILGRPVEFVNLDGKSDPPTVGNNAVWSVSPPVPPRRSTTRRTWATSSSRSRCGTPRWAPRPPNGPSRSRAG